MKPAPPVTSTRLLAKPVPSLHAVRIFFALDAQRGVTHRVVAHCPLELPSDLNMGLRPTRRINVHNFRQQRLRIVNGQ